MKKTFVVSASLLCFVAFGKISISDEKYAVNIVYGLTDSYYTYFVPTIEGAGQIGSTPIPKVKQYYGQYTLDDAIKLMPSINTTLWNYFKSSESPISQLLRGAAVQSAINVNNAEISTAMQMFLLDVSETADNNEDTINDFLKVFGVTSSKDLENSKWFKDRADEIQGESNNAVAQYTAQITALQEQIKNAASGTDVAALQAQVNSLQTQMTQYSLSAAAAKTAADIGYLPISYAPVSAGDRNFTNAMAAVSAYLGGSVTNSGVNFAPPDAKDILDYLNKKGVVGYTDNAGANSNAIFAASFALDNTGGVQIVTAPFAAPSNWADGTTIICSNGVYSAYPRTAWHWQNGEFVNATILTGKQVITPPNTSANSAGNWYCHVVYENGGFTATLSQESTANDNEWVWLVGTLAEVDGVLTATYELATTPIILCYQ